MSDLPLISALEAGSTDLQSCLSTRPELSNDEKLELILADQRYRISMGIAGNADYYSQKFPWLVENRNAWHRLIIGEYQQQLLTNPKPEFFRLFVSNITNLDDTLFGQFLQVDINQKNSLGQAVEWEAYRAWFPEQHRMIDELQKEYVRLDTDVNASRQNEISLLTQEFSPFDLTRNPSGIFVSDRAIGDLRGGRYRMERPLGQGAFGAVYLAEDTELKRQVAIKIPRPDVLAKLGNVDTYLSEARNVAALDHPHIVAVYDVGRTSEGSLYVVSKYIEGNSLAEWNKIKSPDFETIVRCMEKLAEALHHAHQKRLIHRDIKPANILIEEASGTPYLADFGLSIREEDYLQVGHIAGTPAYMSPEQIRGEGHRLDGRSDLFSLGVVMYQILTGRLPFQGRSFEELAHNITTVEPLTPCSLRSEIPLELERICLKLLRKRASERYANGRDLAEDLRAWLTPSTARDTETAPKRITPRGLRSFTADDSGFFLDLLPGPRNRDGLPESVAFWKAKIEQRDPDQTFSVGLLYGPSGCGKSSLVKAGLIPSLSPDVIVIYIEATPDETEIRLLRQLSKRIPDLARDRTLGEVAERVRRSEGPKVLLIIDQFEQWLYSHRVDLDSELVRGLRQCDGSRLQTILMIRDDFYLLAARLMNHLDIQIITDQNCRLVDLFDAEHAKHVLFRFGEAFGRLPMNTSSRSSEHNAFVDQVVKGLSEGNKVVSVQLSLFADMLKARDWIPTTLKSIGGLEGIGISFLEETFTSNQADVRHRTHQVAVRGVLRALLPDSGADIKRSACSEEELLDASGYADQPHKYQDLLRILDGELRLLTPVDFEGYDSDLINDTPPRRYYQLTHDYLIPSLREWLTSKQRETRKGRAELKLAERTAAWTLNRESKQLPTSLEWLHIHLWTNKKRWSHVEKTMMRTASRWYLRSVGSGAVALIFVCLVLYYALHRQNLQNQHYQIRLVLDSLQQTTGPALPNIIRELKEHRSELVESELRKRFEKTTEQRQKLAYGFALAAYEHVEAEYLISKIDDFADNDTPNLFSALAADRENALRKIQAAADLCTTQTLWRRKARLGLLALGIGDASLPVDICEFNDRADHSLRTLFIEELPNWRFDLEPVLLTVSHSDSSALRSAFCLGLGGISKDQLSDEEVRLTNSLLDEWYLFPDSSTHCAVKWLKRRWGLAVPEIEISKPIDVERDWSINSQGATMVRIVPSHDQPNSHRDPRDELRRWLNNHRSPSPELLSDQDFLAQRIHCLFYTSAYDEALEALEDPKLKLRTLPSSNTSVSPTSEGLLETQNQGVLSSQEVAFLRLMCNARLKKAEETEVRMREWLSLNPTSEEILFVTSIVPLWLGRIEESSAKLRNLIDDLKSSQRFQHTFGEGGNRKGTVFASPDFGIIEQVYQLAMAATLFSEEERITSDEQTYWRNNALSLLEQWNSGDEDDRETMLNDPYLISLHDEPRFKLLVSDPLNNLKPFRISHCEITRQQFEQFIKDASYKGPKPRGWKIANKTSPSGAHPAQSISWYDAVLYCNWLSLREGRTPVYIVKKRGKDKKSKIESPRDKSDLVEPEAESEVNTFDSDYEEYSVRLNGSLNADGYRLPTLAEWQYACRSGTKTSWSHGDQNDLLERYCHMAPAKIAAICGSKLPNAWGLHDMNGNVMEWCWNESHFDDRVYMGGSWRDEATVCRWDYRDDENEYDEDSTEAYLLDRPYSSWDRTPDLGFRVVLTELNPFASTAADEQ